jgi:hypothetical protein
VPLPAVQPAQPGQPRVVPAPAARLAQLEEDLEVLEAARDVKKARVRAAEVGIAGAKARVDLLAKINADGGIVSATEQNTAKFDLEMAKAQLGIRMAELKEAEVKVKYAKKRLDDAKANGVRPAPLPGPVPAPVRPLPVDPPPQAFADEKLVADLKAQIAETEAQLKKNEVASKKAEVELKAAEEALAVVIKAAENGIIAVSEVKDAQDKAKAAKEIAEKLAKERKAQETTLADLRAKLKAVEK